jgi:hypothetical protein
MVIEEVLRIGVREINMYGRADPPPSLPPFLVHQSVGIA